MKRKTRKKILIRRVTCFFVLLLFTILLINGTLKKAFLFTENTVKNKTVFEPEIERDVPLLYQYDSKWCGISYGDTDIETAGCAPTCLTMVIRYLTEDKEITPDKVAKYAEDNGYYMENTGTMWTLMYEGCEAFDITGTEIPLDESTIFKQLEKKHPIICSMGPGDFTTEGHFIVLSAIQDGKIIVNDPNSKKRSNRLWDYDKLKDQIKNLWVYKKN